MSEPYARLRVRREQAELLEDVLFHARGDMIEDKIAAREAGKDTAPLQQHLKIIKYLMEEVHRTLDDLDTIDADPDHPYRRPWVCQFCGRAQE
jgi:hypothetical protein